MGDYKLAFSTESGSHKKKQEKDKTTGFHNPGPMKMRLETKGRGGKAVTVLFDLTGSKEDAKSLMKDLQGALSTGATLKDARVELRGDQRDKVEAYLAKVGVKVVRAGG